MLGKISHRRRLLRKSVCRSPHKRSRDSSVASGVENFNKPYDTKDLSEPLTNKKSRKSANAGYKMAYRRKYYQMNNDVEEESEEDDSS